MKGKQSKRPRIVVKIIRRDETTPSGVWKVAYADFVTAMMAFFLLMWLLSSTSENDLKKIAQYFSTPLSVALSGGRSDDASSTTITEGNDTDLTREKGHVAKNDADLAAAEMELKRLERQRLEHLKSNLEKLIDSNPSMRQFKSQLLIDITVNGLRIQIVDEEKRPMFDLGSAVLQPYATQILHEIGKTLNAVPNRISLSGHTDATPYQGSEKNYNNWDLSIDRANAARQALIAGGMDGSKVLRVLGLAAAVPLNKHDPYDPINRRISIFVMNKQAAESASRDAK